MTPSPLGAGRWALLGVVLVVALALQTSFFPHLAVRGVVPDLCLLVVVGVALARGPRAGMLFGFVAGLLLDLAPPAEHVAGRWALSLVVVGLMVGWVRANERRGSFSTAWASAAAASFVGTSIFALTGLLVGDLSLSVSDLLPVVLVALVWDICLAPPILLLVARICRPTRGAEVLTGASGPVR